jgi:hypothetical protein
MTEQIDLFDRRFRSLHERSLEALGFAPAEQLYRQSLYNGHIVAASFGESLLRSAAAVEQTFGGLTTRLWDDPFEWTLPEELSTSDKINEYLTQVEETRRKGFRLFTSDADLMKQLPAPEKLTAIFDLLLETLARAEHFQGRAFAILQMISDVPLPRRFFP